MTIYIDIVFIINFIADITLNFTCCIILDRRIGFVRLTTISMLEAVYGIMTLKLHFLSNAAFAFFFSCIIIFLLFGSCGKSEFIKRVASYYMVCVVTCGACALLAGYTDTPFLYCGKIFFPANDFSIFIALIFVCASSKIIKAIIRQRKIIYNVTLKSGSNNVSGKAYYDTGNSLTEPARGRPVIIINQNIADSLGISNATDIKYNTVSDRGKTLPAIHIEEIFFCDEKKTVYDIYGGICQMSNKDFDILLQKHVHP